MDDLYRRAIRAVATLAIPALVALSLGVPASAKAASSNPLIANAKVVSDGALDQIKGTGPLADFQGRQAISAIEKAIYWGRQGILRSGSSETTAYFNARYWALQAAIGFNRAYRVSPL